VERSDTHHFNMRVCPHDRLPSKLHCRGSFFFTVNLAERRLRLLTEHIDELRKAFRETRRDHPFTINAMVILPSQHSSFHRMVKLGVYPEDWAGDVSSHVGTFGERP